MPLPATLTYHLSPGASAEDLLSRLEERLRLHPEAPPSETRTYFDSFDGRLHRAGRALWTVEGEGGPLLTLETPTHRLTAKLPKGAVPGFAWDLPAGSLRRALEGPLSMRRLLPRSAVRREERELRLLDEREKTVARLVLTTREVGAPGSEDFESLPAVLRLVPVRGYPEAFESARKVLEGLPDLAPTERKEASEASAACGIDPGGYSSKLRIRLDPGVPSAEAARIIHRALLATVEANGDGLRRDLDSEFLHDFRVAVRRTRSALGQVKGVFRAEPLARFRKEFSWLGKLTGPTRDLDVYLLKIPGYVQSLPAAERQHLAPLEAFLLQRQRREQRRMVRGLDSARYRELIASWRAFLDQQPGDDCGAPNARMPIRRLASARLRKVSKRVLARGAALGDDSPAAALHALRIDCKKLRYLLEFFRSLYDEGEISKLVKALKRLQDNLGDFNDYAVQQAALRGFAHQMAAAGAAPPETLLVLGRLVVLLEEGQAAERRRFAGCFGRLAALAGRDRLRGLFTVG